MKPENELVGKIFKYTQCGSWIYFDGNKESDFIAEDTLVLVLNAPSIKQNVFANPKYIGILILTGKYAGKTGIEYVSYFTNGNYEELEIKSYHEN